MTHADPAADRDQVTVGVVVAEFSPHTAELLQALEFGLAAAGLRQEVSTSAHRLDRELECVELFARRCVRGIVVSSVGDPTSMLRIVRTGIPVVMLGRRTIGLPMCSVSGSDDAGGRAAVEHLVSLGHHRIAVAGGEAKTYQVAARIGGARRALTGSTELTVMSTPGYGIQDGLDLADRISRLSHGHRPTAILAINDSIAMGIVRGLQRGGIHVPEDISVIGYDDVELARTSPVPLTTIKVSSADLGQHAAELLLLEIAEAGQSHTHRQILLHPQLIRRLSTAPAVSPAPTTRSRTGR